MDSTGVQLRPRKAQIPQVDGAGDEEMDATPNGLLAPAKSEALVDEESLFDTWLTEPEGPCPGDGFPSSSLLQDWQGEQGKCAFLAAVRSDVLQNVLSCL